MKLLDQVSHLARRRDLAFGAEGCYAGGKELEAGTGTISDSRLASSHYRPVQLFRGELALALQFGYNRECMSGFYCRSLTTPPPAGPPRPPYPAIGAVEGRPSVNQRRIQEIHRDPER